MTIETAVVLFVLAQAIALVGLFWRSANRISTKATKDEERFKALEEKVQGYGKVLERVTTLETKVEHFWSALGKQAAAMLHSPDHPRRDELLEKYMRNEIGYDELHRLVEMLEEIDRGGDPAKAQLARVLLRAIHEQHGKRLAIWPPRPETEH